VARAVLEIVTRMARETAEGQATELAWIRWGGCALRDTDYLRLAFQKTCWYSFLAPVLVGATIASVPAEPSRRLARFAGWLGLAFQIHDDILNLDGREETYGKEVGGDLIEGKYTLILMHALRSASDTERVRALRILRRPRGARGPQDAQALSTMIRRHDSIDYARRLASRMAERARHALVAACRGLDRSAHVDLLFSLIDYCLTRDR
jgi:geranylgeranyl diphosphate synthase type II